MVTKATRDVVDLGIRGGIDVLQDPTTTFIVNGDCSSSFVIGGVIVGGVAGANACDGTFTNLTAQNITVPGTLNFTGATLIGTLQSTYSDIAENYESDKEYPPGTVVKIGGEKEITATAHAVDDAFGVISSEPAYILNSGKEGLYLPVVMVGRIPVRIVGPVTKGDRLVSSDIPGVARMIGYTEMECSTPVFGRALETCEDEHERTIEAAFVTVR